jgi:hypothetical protein
MPTACAGPSITWRGAFAALDLAVCAAVDGFLINSPPGSPAAGSSYVIGSAPTGAWTGHNLAFAGYTEGGWRFIPAVTGLTVLDKASGELATYLGGAWEKGHVRGAKLSVAGNQVVGARLASIADPTGGTTVDVEARAAISAILARLRGHGLIAP